MCQTCILLTNLISCWCRKFDECRSRLTSEQTRCRLINLQPTRWCATTAGSDLHTVDQLASGRCATGFHALSAAIENLHAQAVGGGRCSVGTGSEPCCRADRPETCGIWMTPQALSRKQQATAAAAAAAVRSLFLLLMLLIVMNAVVVLTSLTGTMV